MSENRSTGFDADQRAKADRENSERQEAERAQERDRMERVQQGPAPWQPPSQTEQPVVQPSQHESFYGQAGAIAGPKSSPDMRLEAMEMALHLADGRTHDHKQVVEMAQGILEFLEGPEVVAQRKEAMARKQVEDQKRAVEAQREANDAQRQLDANRSVPRR